MTATSAIRRARRATSLTLTVALLPLFVPAPPAHAQSAPAAESTLGDVLQALDSAARIGHLETSDPAARRTLDSLRVVLSLNGLSSLTVTQVANAVSPGDDNVPSVTPAVVGRFKRATRTVAFSDAVFTVVAIGNVQVVNGLRAAGLPREAINDLLRPHDALVRAMRRAAHERNVRLLRNFERKYGPTSPQLNYVEVALNYAVQFLPFLGTTESSGPSPVEIIASYQTTSLKVGMTEKDPPRMVSGVRAGFRFYFFGDGWADSGMVAKYVRPSHMSLGIYTMGPNDQSLSRAWGRGYRAGPFLGWGDLYAGALIDPDHRIVIGVAKQLVPRLF